MIIKNAVLVIIALVIAAVAGFGIPYLLGVFLGADWDMSAWHITAKVLYLLIGIIVSVVSFFVEVYIAALADILD